MLKMIHLVQNENMKLYRKIGTWVMIGLLVVALIFLSSLNTFVDEKVNEKQMKATIEQEKIALDQPGISKQQKRFIERDIQLLELCVKYKVSYERIQIFLSSVVSVLSLITCLGVIVAASIVSKEFSDGTIKLLLIRPISRSKILISKYATVVLSAMGMLLLHFVLSSIMFNVLFKPAIYSFVVQDLFSQYGYFSIELLLVLTLAFMISTVFRNQGLAIGLTLFLYLTGGMIVQFLARYFSGAKYLLFANWDLSRSYEGVDPTVFPGLHGITTSFSISVIIFYYLAFIAITWVTFNKRDVAV